VWFTGSGWEIDADGCKLLRNQKTQRRGGYRFPSFLPRDVCTVGHFPSSRA
jgi:hypothetical protein